MEEVYVSEDINLVFSDIMANICRDNDDIRQNEEFNFNRSWRYKEIDTKIQIRIRIIFHILLYNVGGCVGFCAGLGAMSMNILQCCCGEGGVF